MQRRVMHSRHAFGHHAGPDLADLIATQLKVPTGSNHTITHAVSRAVSASKLASATHATRQ